MILQRTTSTVLRLVTVAACDIRTYVAYVDRSQLTTFDVQGDGDLKTAITTATTTTISPAPAANITRNFTTGYIENFSASISSAITIEHFDGTTATPIESLTLLPNEKLEIDETGRFRHLDAAGAEYQYSFTGVDVWNSAYGITGTVAESLPRIISGVNVAALTSGTLQMQAVYLKAGMLLSNMTFFSGSTASITPTNGRFALYDINRNLLAQTADFTTEAWGASAVKTKAFTTAYRVPTSGLYYGAILIVATTVNTLAGATSAANVAFKGMTPIISGTSTTALTTTLPSLAAALSASLTSVWFAFT
jgi:hypothetical protein